MRRFLCLVATTIVAACSHPQASAAPTCQGVNLERAELIEVVKEEFKTSGLAPKVLDDQARVRIEIATVDCDYLVRVTSLPEKPGGFTVYRISRSRKIINILAGD